MTHANPVLFRCRLLSLLAMATFSSAAAQQSGMISRMNGAMAGAVIVKDGIEEQFHVKFTSCKPDFVAVDPGGDIQSVILDYARTRHWRKITEQDIPFGHVTLFAVDNSLKRYAFASYAEASTGGIINCTANRPLSGSAKAPTRAPAVKPPAPNPTPVAKNQNVSHGWLGGTESFLISRICVTWKCTFSKMVPLSVENYKEYTFKLQASPGSTIEVDREGTGASMKFTLYFAKTSTAKQRVAITKEAFESSLGITLNSTQVMRGSRSGFACI